MEVLCSEVVQYRKLFQMIFVLGIGGSLQIGYQISVITYPSLFIQQFMNATWLERSGVPLPEKTLLFLWSFTVSIYGLGGLLGSICSSYLTVKYGKRRTMLATDLLVITAAFLLGFSKKAKSLEMILMGRFLCGVSAGFCLLIHPQYAGEVSPKKLRGFANATTGFFWSLGKSLGQILGLRETLGTEPSWPLLLSFTGITALLQLLTLPFFPESPPYLLIQKGDEESCLKAMRHLWGQGDHQEEISDLKKEAVAEKSSKILSAKELLRDSSQRQQLYILLTVTLALQLGGINAVYFYMSQVLQAAGFAEMQIPYLALGVGFCELSSSVICVLTIEKFGRRSLLWKGCLAMALVTLFLTITLSLQSKFCWMSHCSLGLIFSYVILFGIGPNGVTMSVMMEIFSQSSRPAAFLLGGCLNWAGIFLIGVTFPFAVDALGPFCFLIFMFVLMGSGAFFYLFLPETKGKSITEITEEFKTLPFRKTLAPVFRNSFHAEHLSYTSF